MIRRKGWTRDVATCGTCGATVGAPCRAALTGRVVANHAARVRAACRIENARESAAAP